MTRLLLLPGNAVRHNTQNSNGFPTYENQAVTAKVTATLNHYKDQGDTIVVCENAGGVEKHVTPFLEKLSELIALMRVHAPQIDHLLFCTDYQGAFAYLLSQAKPLPQVQRLRNSRVLAAHPDLIPPDDPGQHPWQDVDVSPFRKPDSGMLEAAITLIAPGQVIGVWERAEDKDAISALQAQSLPCQCQSVNEWLNITTSQAHLAANQNTAVVKRRFEYINPAINSDKFWEIQLTPDRQGYIVCHGRRGTQGRKLPAKMFPSEVAAIAAYDAKIKDQLRDGYYEV